MKRSHLAALTMSDLADIAGLSTSTVSRALQDSPLIALKTRRRIQELAREHSYSINPVARSLRSRKTGTIAVVVPLVHEADQPLSDPFFMAMLSHLADALSLRGCDLLLQKVPVHADDWVSRTISNRRADAVIVIGQSLEHASIDAAARDGVPVVAWGAMLPDQHYATVGSDNREGGRLAAVHLLGNGRRRLAFLGNCELPEVSQRFEGFLAAHREVGLPHDPALILPAHFGRNDARRASRALVESGVPFDGVVAASDIIATAMVRALGEKGIGVPQDVGVVGFDDAPLAAFSAPPLTTIRQHLKAGAGYLVDLALAAAGGEVGKSIQMPVELIVRGSTIP